MKLVKHSFEILEQKPGLNGIYEAIERAGRICYASNHNIKYDENGNSLSAMDFVDRMIKSGHHGMLEHGTVYLKIPWDQIISKFNNSDFFDNIFSKSWVKPVLHNKIMYLTSNYRWIHENNLEDLLIYLCEPTIYHEKRISVKFITDIGVSRELNRHRKNSMAESSTRYCNFSKKQFNNEISICENSDIDINLLENIEKEDTYDELINNLLYYNLKPTEIFAAVNKICEIGYMKLIEQGWKPEQARRILPLDTKTELIHTAFVSDWKYFCKLRAEGVTGKPHPDLLLISKPLMEEFKNKNLI